MSRDFRRALKSGLILADGAMGTELAGRGLAAPFERYNLERPDLVLEIHAAYREAGARLLRTNTFLARDAKTALEGARLARRAAGEDLLVGGAMGPGADVAAALAEGGCDVLILETFTDAEELERAIRSAKSTGLPVVAQMASTPDPRVLAAADVAGVNCVDPESAARLLETLRGPLSAFPHAGLPGKRIEPGDFARRVSKLGVKLLGGCCGAGPAHVRALAKEVG